MAYWVLMQAAKESGHIYPWMDTLVEFGPDAPMRGAGWQLVHHSGRHGATARCTTATPKGTGPVYLSF